MKIFNAEQVRYWDEATLTEQRINSWELMERAAGKCFDWLVEKKLEGNKFFVICGKGNNGGDGLAIARMLISHNYDVSVYILETGKIGTPDFQQNLHTLHRITTDIHFIQSSEFFPSIPKKSVIVDCIFGTGLSKPLEGIIKDLVEHLNTHPLIISIDLPSGLFADKSSKGYTAIKATYTLCFQNYKAALLFAENAYYSGEVHLVDLGLSTSFSHTHHSKFTLIEKDDIRNIIKPRNRFSHKGNHGHAGIFAGSYGMMGAATLAVKSCFATGTGKITAYVPNCGYTILQLAIPEAMCKTSGDLFLKPFELNTVHESICIGPGIGKNDDTKRLLYELLSSKHSRFLLDADALNIIAENAEMLKMVPKGTVITPHPKEFDRLFGETKNEFERLELAIKQAALLGIFIVLKGHHTAVITPAGNVLFNNTGNDGMAKAGMGDSLSGIITGLLAQQYDMPEAAIIGVYIHGSAGDIAAEKLSTHAMQTTDLINAIPQAWKDLIQ